SSPFQASVSAPRQTSRRARARIWGRQPGRQESPRRTIVRPGGAMLPSRLVTTSEEPLMAKDRKPSSLAVIALLSCGAAVDARAGCDQPPLVQIPPQEEIAGNEARVIAETAAY